MAPSEARRDQWGRYLVVPPGGNRPLGYTRATTVAKSLEDGGGLIPWKAAVAMTGMMRRPGLRAQFEALLSKHPDTGPWYGGPDAKAAVKQLVEDCANAGGSSDRADLGTALHAIVEQINRGETPQLHQDSTRADVDAYRAMLADTGITFDAELIEATVVLDGWKVAGTADMARMHVPGLGDVIGDLKTGTNLDYSWQSIAIQLGIYAHGDNLYRQGDATDGSDDVRLPVPDVRTDVAVVIHLPAGEGRCRLHRVDIAAGWDAFEHSMWARRWRARKDLATPLAVDNPRRQANAARGALLAKVLALPPERQQLLRGLWPAHMPPLKRDDVWTPELLEECTQLVDQVAAGDVDAIDQGARAVDTGPATPPTAPVPTPGPDAVERFLALTPDEQARAITRGHLPEELRTPPERLTELEARFVALDEARQAWVKTQARIAELPNLAHPARWTIERGDHLATLLDTAEQLTDEQLAPPDWAGLCKAAGITKAAAGREAKRIAAELGMKVPAKVDDLPTGGVFAVQFANWIELTAATKADAA